MFKTFFIFAWTKKGKTAFFELQKRIKPNQYNIYIYIYILYIIYNILRIIYLRVHVFPYPTRTRKFFTRPARPAPVMFVPDPTRTRNVCIVPSSGKMFGSRWRKMARTFIDPPTRSYLVRHSKIKIIYFLRKIYFNIYFPIPVWLWLKE